MKKLSWRTTLFGICTIAGAVFGIVSGQMTIPEALTIISCGIGLKFSADDKNVPKGQL
jgi:hypothetical protein